MECPYVALDQRDSDLPSLLHQSDILSNANVELGLTAS
jgi:hypothetical protein